MPRRERVESELPGGRGRRFVRRRPRVRRALAAVGALADRLVRAPEPEPRQGPFASEGEAERHGARLNVRWSAHLNAYDGFFQTVHEPETGWWVVERRGRREPRERWLANVLTFGPHP